MVTKHSALVDYGNSLLYLGGNLVINTSTRGHVQRKEMIIKKISSIYFELHKRLNFLFLICIHLFTVYMLLLVFCKLKMH